MIVKIVQNLWRSANPRSSSELLARFLSKRAFRELLLATPDKRQLFAEAAKLLQVQETELVREIARRLKIPFIERPAAMDLAVMPVGSVLHLRRAGAIGITSAGSLVGIVCVNPTFCLSLPDVFKDQPLYLAAWEGIARALDESEREATAQSRCSKEQEYVTAGALLDGVLAIMVANTASFNVRKLQIDCSESEFCYRFTTIDGKTGKAPINPSLRGGIIEYCERAVIDRKEVLLHPPALPPVRVRVHRSVVQGRFEFSWDPEVEELSDMTEKVVPIYTESSEKVSTQVPSAARRRVVVVDDNDTFALVLQRFLSRQDVVTTRAGDGRAALQLIQQSSPDLIVCDVHMPGINGIDLVRQIKQNMALKNIPIVMLTSDTDIELEIKLLGAGVDAFVLKSEDPRVMCAHVQRLLVKEHGRREAA